MINKTEEFESVSRYHFSEQSQVDDSSKKTNQKPRWNGLFYLSLLACLLVLSYLFFQLVIDPSLNKKSNQDLAKNYQTSPSPSPTTGIQPQEAGSETQQENKMLGRFAPLYQQNKDVKGWLKISGTANIDYPVVKTNNNEYYLDHGFDKKVNKNGCLFFDEKNQISAETTSQTLIIYGHNMKNGQMFNELKKYRDVAFYQKHPMLEMDTLYQEGRYKILACALVSEHEKSFFTLRDNTGDSNHFLDAVSDLQKKSYFGTTVDVQETDKLLLLSTCSYDVDGSRLVLMARMVRPNEEPFVDTSQAVQLVSSVDGSDLKAVQKSNATIDKKQKKKSTDSIPKTGDDSSYGVEIFAVVGLSVLLIISRRKLKT